jgi:hypothetical protein
VFRIGGNTFYDQKNKILMKILEFKRSGIRLIAEFRRIPNGFPNQAQDRTHLKQPTAVVGVIVNLKMVTTVVTSTTQSISVGPVRP